MVQGSSAQVGVRWLQCDAFRIVVDSNKAATAGFRGGRRVLMGLKGSGFGRVWGEEIEDQSSGVQGEGSCRRSAAGERRAV